LGIKEAVHPERVLLVRSVSKREALLEMIQCFEKRGEVKDIESLKEKIFYREKLMSTGIGLGIAVPHVRMEGIKEPLVVIGVSGHGIEDYGAIDNQIVRIVVMIVAGKEQHQKYIKLLAGVVTHLKRPGMIEKLVNAADTQEVYQAFMGADHVSG